MAKTEEQLERQRIHRRNYYHRNKEKERQYRIRHHEQNRNNKDFQLRLRNQRLKTKYRIGLDTISTMLAACDNKCEICGKEFVDDIKQTYYVDHCHDTKQIRGLLCNKCNLGLGHYYDNIDLLKKAIAYLEKGKPIL